MKALTPGLALGLLCAPLAAQGFDNVWARFSPAPDAIVAPTISSSTIETDLAWGDLDQDGWIDVVVVRKQPATSSGKRRNMLLMNEAGVLTDRTSQYASVSSDVPGDQGFLQATNDRDVVVADLDGDGWLDVVTAVTHSDLDTKAVGHPRVYMNRGDDGSGGWLGLDYQEARIPQLLHFTTGNPQNPRFCGVDAGDVDGDGALDLYFGDYNSGEPGASEGEILDMQDRLLMNDGTGYFVDESQSRMTSQMLASIFTTKVVIKDMNGDGTLDVARDNAPAEVSIAYNNLLDAEVEGQFNAYDADGIGSGQVYHFDTGDLNADGRPDIITSDDGPDRYRINLGNDALGRAQFSGGGAGHTFDYVQGGDPGWAGNSMVVDLDGDGWNEALIADFDVNVPVYNRMHIFHNAAPEQGTPVGGIPTLREEAGAVSGPWVGARGLQPVDLEGVHDFAVADFDNDGRLDLLLSRVFGTQLWLQEPLVAQADLGFGGPGDMVLSVVGDDLTLTDSVAHYEVTGALPGQLVNNVIGAVDAPTPFKGGTLVPVPFLFLLPVPADASGFVGFPVQGGAGPTTVPVYAQAVAVDGGTFQFSNAVEILINL